MTPTTITCAYCLGHDFLLVINEAGTTFLQCVNHDQHMADGGAPNASGPQGVA